MTRMAEVFPAISLDATLSEANSQTAGLNGAYRGRFQTQEATPSADEIHRIQNLTNILFGFRFRRGFTCEYAMKDSQQLLTEYSMNGSDAAFRELVDRYINFVYSTALRMVGGDSQLAEDVTQTVFINLARKGRALSSGVMLGGWLHQHTFHLATKAVRGERRRQTREREAVEMNSLNDNSQAEWRTVAPILDEAITQLGGEDRTAILLRFFEQRDYREVGAALGSNEDAARMRVNRALEKLHSMLKQRGVTMSVAALGTALTTQAVTAAPVGLALVATTAALAGAAAGTGSTLTAFKIMATTKFHLSLTALVVVGAATTLVIQYQSQFSVRQENQTLRAQITQLNADNESLSKRMAHAKAVRAPRLPAPPMQSIEPATASPAETIRVTNLYAWATNSPPKLTAAQIEPYLKANRRSAASLLAAFRTSGDSALLEEAMQKFPNDPQVGFEAALRKDASPEDRRQWLDAFKQSAPDNALANFLSAKDHFKAGQTDQAVQDLIATSTKPQFQDYSLDRILEDEEAYRAAGYSAAEAKVWATAQLLMPHLAQMRELGQSIIELSKSYQQAGDVASQQAALELMANLGRRWNDGSPGNMLIGQLVGIRTEKTALEAMDPSSPFGSNGQTVQDRINQLTQQRTGIQELGKQAGPLWATMTDQDWLSYHSRSTTFGEEAAMRWLVNKYGQR